MKKKKLPAPLLHYDMPDKRLRQRAKLVLLQLAEDQRLPVEERMKAADQLVAITAMEYESKYVRDKARMTAVQEEQSGIREKRKELARRRIADRERKKAVGKPQPVPKDVPRPTGPNALGIPFKALDQYPKPPEPDVHSPIHLQSLDEPAEVPDL